MKSDGFYDASQVDGEITGSGPSFANAMRRFKRRQLDRSKAGQWRLGPAKWKKSNGRYIDRDWDIIS